ncbi:MAG TPA: hypothetical protein VFL85_04625, partial [Candidatus Saccharimonadales bacterium]|nr:hypothetical protein [Candidatus Saccharimonadales bacterium]
AAMTQIEYAEPIERPLTVFEKVWQQDPDTHLFHSEDHGVMAVADAFPKLPLQLVVAPKHGSDMEQAAFEDLPVFTRLVLHTVADAMQAKIRRYCTLGQMPVRHIEGRGVPNHPHIVLFAGEKGQGKDLYTGQLLGQTAVRSTMQSLRLLHNERAELNAQLDQLARAFDR